MDSKTVLELYSEGKRDFSHQDLRGQNFKSKDLSGVILTNSDIRGCSFRNANLKGAEMKAVIGGLTLKSKVFFTVCSWLLLAIGVSTLSFSLFVISGIAYGINNLNDFAGSIISLAGTVVFLFVTLRKGFVYGVTVSIVLTPINILISVAVVQTLINTVIPDFKGDFYSLGIAEGFVAITGIILGFLIITFGSTVIHTLGGFPHRHFHVACSAVLSFSISKYIFPDSIWLLPVLPILGIAVLGIRYSFISFHAEKRDAWILESSINMVVSQGTSFLDSNLEDADFTASDLRNTDFRAASIDHACFYRAKNLKLSRTGNSILSVSSTRDLVVTKDGYGKSYRGLNLEGAHLAGSNLSKSDLEHANLSGALLSNSDLTGAFLTEVQAIGCDFTNSQMTGVHIQAWNVDESTCLERVDCNYIYLLSEANDFGSWERLPYDTQTIFEEGDFEKMHKVLNTVNVLLHGKVSSESLLVALQQLISEEPSVSYDSIQAIEKREKSLLVKLDIPHEVDKGKAERILKQAYSSDITAREQALLLESERNHSKDLKEISTQFAASLNGFLSNITISSNSQVLPNSVSMNNTNDFSRRITIGDIGKNLNIDGSSLNMGNTNVQIAHRAGTTDNASFNDLLSRLNYLFEEEEGIPDEAKATALNEIQNLRKVDVTQLTETSKNYSRKSLRILRGLIGELPTATKLLEETNKIILAISTLLGFL